MTEFFERERPDYVFLAAARVGGIHANNSFPADFLRDNLQIQTNVMREDCLLTGPLEPTNEWYAIAKIAGLKMCQAYRRQYGFNAITAMRTNLYGPGGNFDLHSSHVLPALLRKFHQARVDGAASVEIWGTGTPRREFLHVDDLADASIYLMSNYDAEPPVNVGWGKDVSIAELAQVIAGIVGFEGHLEFDRTKPDGTPRKLLDTARINELGWNPRIELEDGIRFVYSWFVANLNEIRSGSAA